MTADEIKLERISRRGEIVSVVISSLDQPLVITESIVQKYRLTEGVVLTPTQVEQLMAEAERLRCFKEATRLLAMRDHAAAELTSKLRQRGFRLEIAEAVTQKYIRRGLIDDVRHAGHLARQIVKQRPCGRAYLVSYLQKKQIDRLLAEQAADECLAGTDEVELAVAALRKRWWEFGQFELEVAQRKAYNYLARRGFGFPVASAAFERVTNDETR